ncbi:MAG: carboxypeptidase-like regulatory domain-containing protein, partial [Chitinophagales bacterium]
MKLRWWVWWLCALLALGGFVLVGLWRLRPPAGPRIEGQVGRITRPGLFSLSGLGGAQVAVTPGGYATKTRRDGSFTLPLPPGVYQLTISAPGRLPFVERVQVTPAVPAAVWPVLFAQPAGPPVASLMRSESTPGSGPIAYNTGIYLDASRSKNVDPQGIRWEVTDAAGRILQDPYAVPPAPLQLKPSPIPGTSPMVFTFVPPAPGRYRVRLFLRNSFS